MIQRQAISIRSKRPFGALFRAHVLPHWRLLTLAGLASLTTAAAGVSYGWLVKQVGDGLQSSINADQLGAPLIFMLGCIVIAATVRAVSLYASTLWNNIAVQKGLVSIQAFFFGASLDQNMQELSGLGAGPFVSRFIHEIDAIRIASLRLVANATRSVLTIIGACLLMLIMDWQLFLVIVAIYPVAYGPVQMLGRRIRKAANRIQSQLGDMSTLLTETAQSVRFFKSYGLEDTQRHLAREQFRTRSNLFIKRLKYKAAIDPLLEITGGIVIAVILGFCAWRISNNAATLGDVLGYITLIGLMAPELRALGSLMAVLQDGSAAAERLLQFSEASSNLSGKKRLERRPLETLAFEEVSFSFGGSAKVLDHVHLSIEAGQWVSVMGPSGSGKSTLLDVLLGLYRPQSGHVTLNGQNLYDRDRADTCSLFALVEQETILLEDTVANNLRLGAVDVADEALAKLCRDIGLHESIMRLPDGYATELGPRGYNLSGGEARRLSLVRALLRDAPVLLLDEALSGLDLANQEQILEFLSGLKREKTILQITHDQKHTLYADQVWHLEEGRLTRRERISVLDNSTDTLSKAADEQS